MVSKVQYFADNTTSSGTSVKWKLLIKSAKCFNSFIVSSFPFAKVWTYELRTFSLIVIEKTNFGK